MADEKTVLRDFLEQQVKFLHDGDTAGLARQYAEDAIFVRFDRIARGREEIRTLFDDYLTEQPQVTGMDALQVTDDVILYQAAVQLSGRLTTAVGTIVFRNKLVWRQTAAFVEHRPLRQADSS